MYIFQIGFQEEQGAPILFWNVFIFSRAADLANSIIAYEGLF